MELQDETELRDREMRLNRDRVLHIKEAKAVEAQVRNVVARGRTLACLLFTCISETLASAPGYLNKLKYVAAY